MGLHVAWCLKYCIVGSNIVGSNVIITVHCALKPWADRSAVPRAPLVCSCASVHTDVVPAWSAAVKPMIQQLKQQQQQQGAEGDTLRWQARRAGGFLLQVWNTNTLSTLERPAVFDASTMTDAAELAVLLLTLPRVGPGERADGSGDSTSLGAVTASHTLHLICQYVHIHGRTLIQQGPDSAPPPAALVSDAVQQAMALHLSVWLAAYGGGQQHQQQQQQDNSTTAHIAFLQQLGFPHASATAYADQLLQDFGPDGPSAPDTSISQAATVLQFTLLIRASATTVRGWQRRYANTIAAAATATAPAPVQGWAVGGGALPRDGRLFALGVDPVQLQLLVLEVSSYASERASYTMFAAFLDLALTIQDATPTTHDAAEVVGAVKQMWLGLGRKLLLLTGVPAAELVAHTGSISAAAGSCTASTSAPLEAETGVDAVTPLPASAADELKKMWARFALTLFRTLSWATQGKP